MLDFAVESGEDPESFQCRAVNTVSLHAASVLGQTVCNADVGTSATQTYTGNVNAAYMPQ